jgi:hypothetical protein
MKLKMRRYFGETEKSYDLQNANEMDANMGSPVDSLHDNPLACRLQ